LSSLFIEQLGKNMVHINMLDTEVKQNIFVMAGRTGGPLLPAMAIAKELSHYTPIIVGVKDGFESKYAASENIQLLTLPEAKLTLASFSGLNIGQIIFELIQTILMAGKLIWSFVLCFYYLIKYKPKAMISAGSFLGVPMAYAIVLSNLIFSLKTKIIVHQQDAKMSLSNKLIAKFADKVTCNFPSSKEQFGSKSCEILTNPIDFARFKPEYSHSINVDESLKTFISNKSKPLLLIFGGGSGAFAINKWVFENIEELKKSFNILHLTGVLQTVSVYNLENSEGYFGIQSLNKEMPIVLQAADLVICRAGMSSISELMYLSKPAFLIPIPNSHQTMNAKEVSQYFPTLRQQYTVNKPGKEGWLSTITELYPTYFKSVNYPDQEHIEASFDSYIQKLKALLS
jgi:UDP-N-acetylglucosamine--N-acetylmuramyl-(pentapeptide) pyrophosphoryl-undecaprenol N-acetylglucosamine transferase